MTAERLRLLIVGGYGVFGGRLARLLADDTRLTMLIAGRSHERAAAFCRSVGGTAELVPTRFDRTGDLSAQLKDLAPDIVVDASGPFQDYRGDPYGLVRSAIASKVHYLDLADGSAFVDGVAQFDDDARTAGIYVLSGVSSFPVLTAAVVRHLTQDDDRIETITGGIAPSPYAGVGENVIRAIASYAGQRVALTRNGREGFGYGLGETTRYTIAPPGRLPLHNTLFSLVDVPDLRLLPKAWPGLRSIWMGAGPVPEILHRMLIGLTWLVRLRLLPSLGFASPLFHRAINTLRWGEHRGGMFVEVCGTTAAGASFRRSWHLLAEGEDGPFIPSMAVEALVRKQLGGTSPATGARSAITALELADYREVFAGRTIHEGVRDDTTAGGGLGRPLFARLLGSAWEEMPAAVRRMHDGRPVMRARGRAEVFRSRNPLAMLLGGLFGFPASGSDVPVEVEITSDYGQEHWQRRFAGARFSSRLREGRGRSARLLEERFGLFRFGIALVAEGAALQFIVRRWSVAGMPLPRFLAPGGTTRESVDEQGRFRFDVEIRAPLFGRLVAYHGHLTPVSDTGPAAGEAAGDAASRSR